MTGQICNQSLKLYRICRKLFVIPGVNRPDKLRHAQHITALQFSG
jgi:hypothetical protein